MKNIAILFVILTLGLTACEGPVGPVGPPGDAIVGTTFEFTGDFTASNNYELLFNFRENGIDPYESDVVLAYILWKTEDGLDYWRPMPQNEYFDSGAILRYNYDFTADIPNNRLVDMLVFLDGDVILSTLPTGYTHDQTFRIVVVPSDFLNSTNIDVNNIDDVLNSSDISFKDMGSLSFQLK
nr:hypothetical protein [uncultured Carboxylicivirga sp.]